MHPRLTRSLRGVLVGLALVFVASTAHAGPLIPGALVATDFNGNVTQFSTAGVALDTFKVTGTNLSVVGLAYINGTLYINDVTSKVYSVNPVTGAATFLFNSLGPTQPEGLGNIGTDLLVVGTTGNVERWTTSGTFLGSFFDDTLDRGVDSDGSAIYVAVTAFPGSSSLRTFTATATPLGSFAMPSGASSVAYDPDTDTIWVGFGFGDLMVRNYTKSGTLLSSFSAGVFGGAANGLEYIPGAVPEPATMTLLGLGIAGIVARRRRR